MILFMRWPKTRLVTDKASKVYTTDISKNKIVRFILNLQPKTNFIF